MTRERLEQIRRWRARAEVLNLEGASPEVFMVIFDQWLMIVDELIAAIEEESSPLLH